MLTSVLPIPTRVTITPTVLTPRVRTAVGANQVSLEMEQLAKVLTITHVPKALALLPNLYVILRTRVFLLCSLKEFVQKRRKKERL